MFPTLHKRNDRRQQKLHSCTHLQLAEPPEERRAWGTNLGVHQHGQTHGLYFGPKGEASVQYLILQTCHLPAQLHPSNFLPQPGDAAQVEQETDEFMVTALGVKPGRAMGTEKQHCPAFYIPSPCGEKAVNTCPIKSPPPTLPLPPVFPNYLAE